MIEFWKMTSEELRKFLIMSRRQTYTFWFENLKKITPQEGHITEEQLHYGARFLTRSSTIPAGTEIKFISISEIYFPTFTALFELLTKVLDLPKIPETKEIAACQILILSGFYHEYAKQHYNIDDMTKMGQAFFNEGAIGKKREVIKQVSANFRRWQNLLAFLRNQLEQESRLINIKSSTSEPLIKIVSN